MGLPESPVTGLTLRNWNLYITDANSPEATFRPAMDFENSIVPSTAVYARNIERFSSHNVRLNGNLLGKDDFDLQGHRGLNS